MVLEWCGGTKMVRFDPVLFRPEQLLAIEEQNCHIAAINNFELDNMSGITRSYLHPPAPEQTVQRTR